jgi:hypothetical protein
MPCKKPKIHYRIKWNPPLADKRSQLNPVNIFLRVTLISYGFLIGVDIISYFPRGLVVNSRVVSELDRLWKETIVTEIEVISPHLPRRKIMKTLSNGNRPQRQDMNPGSPGIHSRGAANSTESFGKIHIRVIFHSLSLSLSLPISLLLLPLWSVRHP